MFKCEFCKTSVPAHISVFRIVIETRQRIYPPRARVHRVIERPKKGRSQNKKKAEYTDDPGGRGWEIVREAKACPACAAAHLHPDEAGAHLRFVKPLASD
jgi:hypothetical protein